MATEYPLHLWNPHSDANATATEHRSSMGAPVVYTLCGEEAPLGIRCMHYESLHNLGPGCGRVMRRLEILDAVCHFCLDMLLELIEQGHLRRWGSGEPMFGKAADDEPHS